MNQLLKLLGRAKKVAGSLILLLVFLLPLYLSATWIYGATGGIDSRATFSESEVADFRGNYTDSGKLVPFDEPIITITFDDGWETVYTEGFRVLEKYNIKSTQYILGGHFDDKKYLSEDQIKSLQKAGHEVAGHSMTHADLTSLSDEDLEWEVKECDIQLTDRFGEIRDFATPLGASNANVLSHISKYYRSHRNSSADPKKFEDVDINLRYNFDPYNINAFTVRKTTTMAEIKGLIDYTVKRKGWLVLTYHQIDEKDLSNYAVSPYILDDHMNYIRERNIRTATMGQVLDAIEAQKAGR